MNTYEAKPKTDQEYADSFNFFGHGLTFQDRARRDRVFKLIKAKCFGEGHLKIRKTSIRGQLLHPEYVDDYEGTVETGFGNTMYKTYFKVLYQIEAERF